MSITTVALAAALSQCSIRRGGLVNGGPNRDGIPSIENPEFNHIGIADLADSSTILGVYINGTARAYPTYILRWHEIVNDKFGDQSVCVTYSVLAGASVGFYVTEEQKNIGSTGKLYENNLVMYDRGTKEEWVQIMARGTSKCDYFVRVPVMLTKWGSWKELYPETTLLSTRTNFDRDYNSDPYPGYSKNDDIYFVTSYREDANPYDLHPPKSNTLILSMSDNHFLFSTSLMRVVKAFAFKLTNVSTEDTGIYQTLERILPLFGLSTIEKDWVKDFAILVAYNDEKVLSGCWLISTNETMQPEFYNSFTVSEKSSIFSTLNFSTVPPWEFNVDHIHGEFQAPRNLTLVNSTAKNYTGETMNVHPQADASNGSALLYDAGKDSGNGTCLATVTVRFAVNRVPLSQAYWFTATSIFPTANVLIHRDGKYFFESYDPLIIYQRPWRPWMVASIVLLFVLASILLSCLSFSLYHCYNHKRFGKMNYADELYLMQHSGAVEEEVKLLVEAGLLSPQQVIKGSTTRNPRQSVGSVAGQE